MTANRTPLLIELTCRRCGESFVPAPEAIQAGPDSYRVCPACQRPPAGCIGPECAVEIGPD